jgi:hypothetical protein
MKLEKYQNHLLGNVTYFIIHDRQQAYTTEIDTGLFFDISSGMRVRSTERGSGTVAAVILWISGRVLTHIHPTFLIYVVSTKFTAHSAEKDKSKNTNSTYNNCYILVLYSEETQLK